MAKTKRITQCTAVMHPSARLSESDVRKRLDDGWVPVAAIITIFADQETVFLVFCFWGRNDDEAKPRASE